MLLALSGVTGIGKSYFKERLVEELNFHKVNTIRTRPIRIGEKNGVDGIFITDSELDELKKQTSSQREELERSIESNKEILRHQEEEKQIYIKKGKEVIQKELDLYKTEERSKIELENQELKHKLGEEYNNSRIQIQKKLEELQEKSNLKIAEDLRLQQEIELELEEYRSKRAAINEAIRRERAIEEESDFYRIIIPEHDQQDISVLSDIAPRLRNKEVLNKLIYETFIKRPLQEMTKRVVPNKTSGIYKITYIKTGESYIGRSSDISNR